jgi:hypothetical protein
VINFNWNDILTNPLLASGRGAYKHAYDVSPANEDTPSGITKAVTRRERPRNDAPSPDALAFLISAVAAKEAASPMKNQEAAGQIRSAADAAISQFVDDYCGTPWPFPGPPPWVAELATQLTWTANNVQTGGLRTGLLELAGRILDRVALNPQPLPPGAR